MLNPIKLYSERLVLDGICREDAELIVKWRSNPDVYKYFVSPHKLTVEEHLKWFDDIYLKDENRIDWMAKNRDGFCVGIFGIKRNVSYISADAEVSYILAPEYSGKGYAKEALGLIVDFCMKEWKCKRVSAIIHKDNKKSILFIEKNGFFLEENLGTFFRYSREL